MRDTLPSVATTTTKVRVEQLELAVVSGADSGRTIAFGDAPVVVGTGADCALLLTDPTISAQHCEVTRTARGAVLRDLSSTNGVFIGSVRVVEAELAAGTRFRLGDSALMLQSAGGQEIEMSLEDHFGPLYGESPAMRRLFVQLGAVAQSAAPLLLEGETGTGKDVTALAVHRASPRANEPFVIFDCGAVAASLLEAELFGYEKGAFTGAVGSKAGLAAAADGGTLMIDEVGELPLELQPKLLRLIEGRELRRVGATAPQTVDVRIIAATHRNLPADVRAGRFREDLYFRLSALKVHIPALRERIGDIAGLVDRLLAERGSPLRFANLRDGDRALLLGHRWPGNVRELRNVVERLVTFSDPASTDLIESDAPPAPPPGIDLLPLPEARLVAVEAFERGYLKELMQRAGNSISEAARLGSVSRQYLQRLLRQHGMR